jgi:hypothetical protein
MMEQSTTKAERGKYLSNDLNLIQQISSEASSHPVSERFSCNFAFLRVENGLFWELTECRSGKSFLTESNSVKIFGPVTLVAVESAIPRKHVGSNHSKAKGEDHHFEHFG